MAARNFFERRPLAAELSDLHNRRFFQGQLLFYSLAFSSFSVRIFINQQFQAAILQDNLNRRANKPKILLVI